MSHPLKAAATISMSRSNSLEELIPQTSSGPDHHSRYPGLEQSFKESVASLSAPKSQSSRAMTSSQPAESSPATSPGINDVTEKAAGQQKEGGLLSAEPRSIRSQLPQQHTELAASGSDVSTGNIQLAAPGSHGQKGVSRQKAEPNTTPLTRAERSEAKAAQPQSVAHTESNGPTSSMPESSAAEKPAYCIQNGEEDAQGPVGHHFTQKRTREQILPSQKGKDH